MQSMKRKSESNQLVPMAKASRRSSGCDEFERLGKELANA
jgi:hypothetical protein